MTKSSSPQHLHVALFPFMSKGHTIPLLHLTKLIHNHRPNITFTIFTTPSNQPFISASLSSLPPNTITIISLPFPTTNDDILSGVESTDQLQSMSLFHSFAFALEKLQPHFETALENLQKSDNPISFLISDEESMQVPDFPWIKVRKDDFDSQLYVGNPQDPKLDFVIKCVVASSMSYGMFVNSFDEIEKPFVDYLNSNAHPKNWCVGPLCLADDEKDKRSKKKPSYYIEWLDKKLEQGKPVLYVAFGSQAEITNEQLKEITSGLEKSGISFLWTLRIKSNQEEVIEGFEDRVKNMGLVVRGWVEQREILGHEIVQGFLSHCGWNSVIESICAAVPILAWPMMAEQHLNAKMVAEEIKVGLRVETIDGSPRGFVKWDGLSKMVKELMEGEMGKKVRNKVEELSEVAKKSVEKGGSSWCNMETLLNELEEMMEKNKNGI